MVILGSLFYLLFLENSMGKFN